MCTLSTYDQAETVNHPTAPTDGGASDAASDSKYHHGNLRDALLAGALAMLESGAGESFSLRELARQVGVSANAPYRHFPSKDALLLAMIAEGFSRLTAAQVGAQNAARARREPAADVFMAAGLAYIQFARHHPGLFRLMFGAFAAANFSEEKSYAANTAYANLTMGMAASIGKPADDPAVSLAAFHAWGLVHGLSQLIIDRQFDNKTTDVDHLIKNVLIQSRDLAAQLRG
jgi:AcrR family transcriptional regulator